MRGFATNAGRRLELELELELETGMGIVEMCYRSRSLVWAWQHRSEFSLDGLVWWIQGEFFWFGGVDLARVRRRRLFFVYPIDFAGCFGYFPSFLDMMKTYYMDK